MPRAGLGRGLAPPSPRPSGCRTAGSTDLGRFCEGQGRYRRAFSRYVEAVIKPEAGGLAIDALQRVQPLIASDGGGRRGDLLRGDHRADDRGQGAQLRRLEPLRRLRGAALQPRGAAEFYTNGHFGDETRGGAIGGALGFEGLISHFGPDEMAFLKYTSGSAARLARRASRRPYAIDLGIDDPEIIVLDETRARRRRQVARRRGDLQPRARVVLERMREFEGFEIDIEARLEDGGVFGAVSLYGPDEAASASRSCSRRRACSTPAAAASSCIGTWRARP